ncbi:MAG: hypothetical protein K8J31_14150 [Anaerolineae bacterium]|nr:hypothetical protein [Anaerolineae bacterium]
MGLRLDWEIESEQQVVRQATGEDPETRRQRRRRRFLILLIPLILLAIIGVVVGAVALRLREVDAEVEKVLVDTVDAEIATLRIGDEQAFMNFQRSASDAWQETQSQAFDAYQTLKLDSSIQLTGQIIDTVVDGSRARVQVQEIIDGTPYIRTWFYWRYEDGWRHVPPDYTFWGEGQRRESGTVTVYYQAVDDSLARITAETVANWLQTGCDSLGCETVPTLRVQIVADPGFKTDWSPDDPWLLRMRSPYTQLARMDAPFDFSLQFEVANLVAERLVSVASNDLQPVYPADVFYLRSSIVSWLVGRFVSINTNAFLIGSLAQHYGEAAVGLLLQALEPESDASVLNGVTGAATLAEANLDWRDFLTWRLALEDELIQRGDEGSFLALYDTRDETVRALAYDRYNRGTLAGSRVVVSVTPETTPAGFRQLRAQAQIGSTEQSDAVVFRLMNEHWLRAN